MKYDPKEIRFLCQVTYHLTNLGIINSAYFEKEFLFRKGFNYYYIMDGILEQTQINNVRIFYTELSIMIFKIFDSGFLKKSQINELVYTDLEIWYNEKVKSKEFIDLLD